MAMMVRQQMKPFKSISLSTSTGPGLSVSVPPGARFSVQVTSTASAGTIAIEGSMDEVTWFTILAAAAWTNNGILSNTSTGPVVAYIRARVATHTSGGKITAYLLGA